MLENIAWQYVNQSEADLRALGYGLVILGGVLAGMLSRSQSELQRAPYFAFSGLLFFAGAASQSMWLDPLSAMAGGYLGMLMAVDIAILVVLGYFFGMIAKWRSRDAFGHARYAVLAFIPLANLVLLSKASKNEVSANRIPTSRLLSGYLGVFLGFVVMAAGVVAAATLEMRMESNARAAENDPVSQAITTEFLIRTQGLAATLDRIADAVSLPQKLDHVTTLAGVQSDAATIRYQYVVHPAIDALPGSVAQNLLRGMCDSKVWRPIFQAGGAMEHTYLRADKREIGTVRITAESCGQ